MFRLRKWRLWERVKARGRYMSSGIARARTLGLAAEMSFWVFLSLVPLAAVAGWLAARVATSQAKVTHSMLATVPAETRLMIERQVDRVAGWRGSTVAPLAVLTFVWLASSGVHAVFEALEVQSGTQRPWWKKRALALVTCMGLTVGVALLGLLSAGLGWLHELAGKADAPAMKAFDEGAVAAVLRWVFAAVLAVAMTAGIYRLGVPRNKEGCRMPVLPGAVLSVALQVALGWGYGVYVTQLGGSESAYQAGLAVVGVTLMTLWLFSIALLLGVNLNGAIAHVPEPQRPARA